MNDNFIPLATCLIITIAVLLVLAIITLRVLDHVR